MTNIKVTLANGAILEGSPDTVRDMLSKLGVSSIAEDGVHYNSDTKGLIPISTMDTRHIRNAVLKIYSQWIENLRLVSDNQFVQEMRKGAAGTDTAIPKITLLAMVKELNDRTK